MLTCLWCFCLAGDAGISSASSSTGVATSVASASTSSSSEGAPSGLGGRASRGPLANAVRVQLRSSAAANGLSFSSSVEIIF